jgi:hypothetical protein
LFYPLADEEYVERIRRGVAVWQRCRPWMIAFYGTMVVAFLGLLAFAATALDVLGQLAKDKPAVHLAFWCGAPLGALLGGLAFKLAHGLVFALSTRRTEELLLRYHDALAESAREAATRTSELADQSATAELP